MSDPTDVSTRSTLGRGARTPGVAGAGVAGAFRRTTGDERRLAGVAGGIARALGVDPTIVRIAIVVLTIGTFVVAPLYLLAWIAVPAADAVASPGRGRDAARGREQAVGIGFVTLGLLLLMRRAGVAVPEAIAVPVALVAAGAALAWRRQDASLDAGDAGRSLVLRLVGGAVLVALGIGFVVAENTRLVVAAQILFAVVATVAGLALLAGPWILRLGRQLADERTERVRADERAEVAAHLHDSVLQTLALIQRRANSPEETVALARRQERELRDWLNAGRPVTATTATLADQLKALADEVEHAHRVPVEVVVVGDAAVDDDGLALVAATRECVVNAAKHAGAPDVSVYAEIDDVGATVYVRDRGRGFDPDAVPADRRGLRESVVGRLGRHGGAVDVRSAPGEGTEVTLTLARSEAAS